MSRAVEKAGRQSEKAAAAAMDRLYERLQSNDFRHVETRIESVEVKARADPGSNGIPYRGTVRPYGRAHRAHGAPAVGGSSAAVGNG